jgi:hypothetical protein
MSNNLVNNKGSNCSKQGKVYEKSVYDIVKCCTIDNKLFNTQKIDELGGSSASHDLICIFNNIEIPIEIKKCNTPDWMQCSLKYDDKNNK